MRRIFGAWNRGDYAGGLAIYRSYLHRDDALRDLGVSEDELEPIDP